MTHRPDDAIDLRLRKQAAPLAAPRRDGTDALRRMQEVVVDGEIFQLSSTGKVVAPGTHFARRNG